MRYRLGLVLLVLCMLPTCRHARHFALGTGSGAWRQWTVAILAAPAAYASSTGQPDLLIRNDAEGDAGYSSAGVAQIIPTGDQVKEHQVAPLQPAVFRVKVVNTGDVAGRFVVRAREAATTGWSVAYTAGGVDITGEMASGYATGTLAPGAAEVITVTLVPPADAAVGAMAQTVLEAFAAGDTTSPRDSVKASAVVQAAGAAGVRSARVAEPRPDLLIKKGFEASSAFAINNVYQGVPAGDQVETQAVNPNVAAVYSVLIQNDSDVARTYVLKTAESSGAGWSVTYTAGTADISAGVRSSTGFTTPALQPGAFLLVTVRMTPAGSVTGGTSKSATVRAFLSSTDTTVRDAVQARTTVNVVAQPDLLIKAAAAPESGFAIDNVYQTTPSGGQVVTQSGLPFTPIAYSARIQNDGNTTRPFLLRAAESPEPGWTITYRLGTADITFAMLSGGFTTRSLAPGASVTLSVEMTPGNLPPPGTTKSTTVRAYLSASDTVIRDAVRARSFPNTYVQPDLLIKRLAEPSAAFALDNVYQSAPAGAQNESQVVDTGATASYNVLIQNDGNVVRAYTLRAVEGGVAGWSTAYRVGSLDVTAQIRSAAGLATPPLAPGGAMTLIVTMRPAFTVPPGAARVSAIRAFLSGSDSVVRDVVRAIALKLRVQADLLIKTADAPDSAYALNNVYQATPSGEQVVSQTGMFPGQTIFVFQVLLQNDSNVPRSFLLRVSHSNPGWLMNIRLPGGTDFTSDLVSLRTPVLNPGASIVMNILIGKRSDSNTFSDSAVVRVFLDETDQVPQDAVQANATAFANPF